MKASEIKAGDRVLWKGREVTVIDAEPVWYRASDFRRTVTKSHRQTNAVLVQADGWGNDVAPLRSLRPLTDAPLLEQREAVERAEYRVKRHTRPDREIVDMLDSHSGLAGYDILVKWKAEHARLLAALETERKKLAEMEAKR